jgi:heme a synthase
VKESRAWVRWLGVIAFFAVVLQGVLGGLRVVWLKDQIGIFHAALAQLFFVCTCALALFTSNSWKQRVKAGVTAGSRIGSQAKLSPLRWFFLVTTAMIFVQLVLGATMRHQHAGLSISDFPLAYGKLWPATDPDSILRYNQQRVEISGINPITAAQIQLQMVHRILAVLILGGVVAATWMSVRRYTWRSAGGKLSLLWLGLILTQVALGAATVLSHKAADIATLHVLVGALSLATGSLLCITSFAFPENSAAPVLVPGTKRTPPTFSPGTAAARS